MTTEEINGRTIELKNGNYYYIEKRGDKLIAGSVCNWGIISDVEIDYDYELPIDDNLSALYDAVKEYDDKRYLERCAICGKEVYRNELYLTHDCHGIPFRYVCVDCYEKTMEYGYDGEYYTELDECIEEDY